MKLTSYICHVSKLVVISISAYFFYLPAAYAAPSTLSPATAAIDASVLRSVDAGLLGQKLTKRPIGISPQPSIKQPYSKQQKELSSPIPGAEKIYFVLHKVNITGNHAISTDKLQPIFAPYLHHKISLATLLELVKAVTDQYQEAGYFLSKAVLPQQNIKGGVVHIQVIEGYINQVNVQGITGKNKRMLDQYGKNITSLKPLKYSELERNLLLINDIPGINVQAVIEPDPTTPFASQLTLVSQHKPVQAAITYDNYSTRYLGPQETTFYSSLNSVIVPGGTLYARALTTADPKEMQYYELRNDQALGTHGLVFGLGGYYIKTQPQFILAPLDIESNSTDIYTNLSYPLIRSRRHTFSLKTQFDYLNSYSSAFNDELYYDRIRDLSIGGDYQDTILRGKDEINLTLDEGFNILGANDGGFRSRAQGKSNFTKVNLTLSRDQTLTRLFSLYGLVTSQYANTPLLAAEEMTFGGPNLGRGYDFAQFSGDEGLAGKIELRLNTNPNFRIIKAVQYYTFYDNGVVWNLDTYPTSSKLSGSSMGFGFRTMLFPHLNAEAFLAKPLTAPNATQVILDRNAHSFLGYFQLSAYF